MLKVFVLFLLLATLATLEARALVGHADNKCLAKFDVTRKEVDDLYDILPQGTDGIDRKFKCYSKCLMDELNYKDENGQMDFKRVAASHLEKHENALEVAADCEAKHDLETDECERSFKTLVCMTLALKTRDRIGATD